jgi:uncharacterized protein involved in exopolysaccharide biosynthesis
MSSVKVPAQDIDLIKMASVTRTFLRAIWRQRVDVLKPAMLLAVVALAWVLVRPPEYVSVMRVIPYRGGANITGGLAGLAGLAGVRLPSGGAEQTITADLYPIVAASLDYRVAVAEAPLSFPSLGMSATFSEYFQSLYAPLDRRLIRLITPQRSGVIEKPGERHRPSPQVAHADSKRQHPYYTRDYLNLLGSLQERLVVSYDRKTSVITISSQMPDPYAAADLTSIASQLLMDRIIQYESRKASETFTFVQRLQRETKIQVEKLQADITAFSEKNRQPLSLRASLDLNRLQREYDIATEVYQQYSRELEQARIKMNQDTPIFTVIDRATVPAVRAGPRRSVIILVCFLAGALIGLGWVGIRSARQRTTEAHS